MDQNKAYMIPTSAKEVQALGWDYIDVILFTGDAFIDHPSFGTAVIARWLQKYGYRVAVVPQPNWRDDLRDFRIETCPFALVIFKIHGFIICNSNNLLNRVD